jgi:hypothetical protein
MSKHVIKEFYSFDPATRTITVTGRYIRKESLLLITNVTTGTVLYNFSDPSLGTTAYSTTVDSTGALGYSAGFELTTMVLAYNTVGMNSTDKLSILVDDVDTLISPSESMRDPVEKLRVSNPQSLIDTDFEYSQQPTKWEQISLINNRPSAFYNITTPTTISNIRVTSSNTITVDSSANPAVGTPVFVQGTLDLPNSDGWWIVDTTSGGSFTFRTLVTPSTNALYDPTKTYLWTGNFYSNAAIGATSISVGAGTTVTVTTETAHGLRVGDSIYVTGTSGVTGGPVNGSWLVDTTPSTNTFTYITAASASGVISLPGTTAPGQTSYTCLYPRSQGYVAHRAFDGGVQFSNVTTFHGCQLIRQTRRYFRYQSGKGIQFSTGTILKPVVDLNFLTSAGTTCTCVTAVPHGLNVGAFVTISGADQAAYNGTFQVATAPTSTTFTYLAATVPSSSPATGLQINVGPASWYGSTNRVGMFDLQNGFYFEFDGQQIYAVRRSSTAQVAGFSTVTQYSNSVTGTGTNYSANLKPGDYIVIRGMSYLVQAITSDTQMYIYPEYRGTSSVNTTISKTINFRIPQTNFNIDKVDGTGASGYDLDTSKMQMFYIDYSWYGAGAVRFGFKNNRGEVVYAHRMPNSNVNFTAYMRSGNLPSHYETNTFPPYSYITSTVSSGAGAGGTIPLASTLGFPPAGTVVLSQAGDTGVAIEYITYSSITGGNTLVISGRAATGGTGTPVTFTYSATAPIKAELYSPQVSGTLSHWGSAVIMDGRYDQDKSYAFNGGMTTAVSGLTLGTRYPLISLRLAPSVDNGLIGLLGAKEIINRMQLTPSSMDCLTANSAFKVDVILNGRVNQGTFTAAGGSSLSQICLHTSGTTITGGESIYSFFAANNSVTSQGLELVRDIGNSILGGGTSSDVPTTATNLYPDGPDILTICATAVTGSSLNNSIFARISWLEAQA